jgi:hypothetical protein
VGRLPAITVLNQNVNNARLRRLQSTMMLR